MIENVRKLSDRESFLNAGLKYLQKMHQNFRIGRHSEKSCINAINQFFTKLSPAFAFHCIPV